MNGTPLEPSLADYVDIIFQLWSEGTTAMKTLGVPSAKCPDIALLIQVHKKVLEDYRKHLDYNICFKCFDLNKLVNYFACRVREADQSITTMPLFWAYLKYLGESHGRAVTIFNIKNIYEICENFEKFQDGGQLLAPYMFIKALDLFLTYNLPPSPG